MSRKHEDDAVQRMAHAASVAPHPSLTKYEVEILKRLIASIQGAPTGSTERHTRRVAALAMCCDIVGRGGCTSATPYECALRLMEVEEECSGTAAGSTDVNYTMPAGTSKRLGDAGETSAVSAGRSASIQRAASFRN